MKKKIIFSSILFLLITISSQFIFHLDINRQSYDTKIIEVSGKQRMYSQQITKIALYANEVKNLYRYYIDLDSLATIVDDFSQDNYYLKNITSKNYKNPTTDKLFKENQIYFKRMINAANLTIDNPNDQEIFEHFVAGVKANEAKFSSTMDKLVNEYQAISKRKLNGFKKILILYGVVTLLFLVFVIWFIILPLYKKSVSLDGK
jgi:nitrate/nitrite-specific signal transduction histidine kinase